MTTETNYEIEATQLLKAHGLTMTATFAGWAPPPWADDNNGKHGARFGIVFEQDGQDLYFDFWNSQHDSHEQRGGERAKGERLPRGGKQPTAYDVLACLSGDFHQETSFSDFCSDFGLDTDSRSAHATWVRCLEHSERLVAFFTPEQIEAIQEVQ